MHEGGVLSGKERKEKRKRNKKSKIPKESSFPIKQAGTNLYETSLEH